MSAEKNAYRNWGRAAEGALNALLAGTLAVMIELLVRAITGLPSLGELLGDQGTRLIPGPLFEALLSLFGHAAKYLYFAGLLIAQIIGLTSLGALAFTIRAVVIRRRSLASLAIAGLKWKGTIQANPEQPEAAHPVGTAGRQQVQGAGREVQGHPFSNKQETAAPVTAQAVLPDITSSIQAPAGWQFSLGVILVVVALSGGLVLPLLRGGFFGVQLSVGVPLVLVSLLVPALSFGVSLPLIQRVQRRLLHRLSGSQGFQRVFSPGRRRFLISASMSLLVLGAGALTWRWLHLDAGTRNVAGADSLDGPPPPSHITPPPTPNYRLWHPVRGQTSALTDTDQFYIVSKNIYSDPQLDASSWHLTITGEGVRQSMTLTYQDLLHVPATEQVTTLECVSNRVGGGLMSTARWRGAPLKELLNMAGIKAGATKVVFHTADAYSDSIHLTKALDPMTLLVYHINDQPLPPEHGFPARMLVPGLYGMKHCKWITQIEVVNYNFQGYWQESGWSDELIIQLGTRIDVPHDGATLPVNRQTYIAGVAFAGARDVSAVDVSTDNGAHWQRAILKPSLGAVTWTLWEWPWTPSSADTYAIVARMIDLTGSYQQPVVAAPFPSGATGYHRIYVSAR